MKVFLSSISTYLTISMKKQDNRLKSRIKKKWKKGCSCSRLIKEKEKGLLISRSKQLLKEKMLKDQISNS